MPAYTHRTYRLTLDGMLAATVVGGAVIHAGAVPAGMLLDFFVLGSVGSKLSAKFGASSSTKTATRNPEKHGRDAIQVLANGGLPAILCIAQPQGYEKYVLAYFACCCGDTMASETGAFSRQLPRLILTFTEACKHMCIEQ